MAGDLRKLYSRDNLRRAWRWINTDPSYKYKNFFRDLYSAYSFAAEENLKDLHERLKLGTYEAKSPCKAYFPKSPYVMRPHTLLSVEDQIVYQAFANVIAEYHFKKNQHRYEQTVFGNLYAGKTSIFFYKKWIESYKRFNKAVKKAYNQGYNYAASFDLTACYDSIDHKVLGYFLEQYGIDNEFIEELKKCLSKWTTNNQIMHGHGIPQGPLASGIISEVILTFLDNHYEKFAKDQYLKYFRYVDDIKIMAKDEISLRQVLVKLDYVSKQVGLFPQSSKIEVHKVEDINKEVKNVSFFTFEIGKIKELGNKEKAIEKKIIKLLKKNLGENTTEFKILLANAKHSSRIASKMLDVLKDYPQLFESISLYLKSYPRKITGKLLSNILKVLEEPEVYQIVNAYLVHSIEDKLSDIDERKILDFIKERWKTPGKSLNPMYRRVIIAWLLRNNCLKFNEIKNIFERETDWWVIKSLLKEIDINFMREPSYKELMRLFLKSNSSDVAISAAHEIIKLNLTINPPYNNINYVAQKVLKYAGVINRASKRPSKIQECLEGICNKKLPAIKWKKVFLEQHQPAENKIIRAYGYSQNDISAFVNILDSFNDLVLHRLYLHDTSLGNYQLGNIGGVTNSTGSALEMSIPE